MCFRINLTKPHSVRQSVTSRKLLGICIPEFIKDLTPILNDTDRPQNELAHAYTTGFEAVVDQHAPIERKSITLRPNVQWYSDEQRQAKHARRRAEKVWRRTKLTVHRQLFREQQKTFFSAKIRDCGKDQKQLFDQLAIIFGNLYIDKVATIRRNINIGNPSDIHETALDDDVMFDGILLQRFLPATHDEVKQIITNSPKQLCVLDPIPTWLLRQCLDHSVPLLTAIINQSLATSVVPACFKRAVVRPLLKRPDLDKEVLNNYRPVSNLLCVSKLLEKVVEYRLKDHLDINNLHDFHQNNYSTETALVKVQNEIAEALDQKRVVVLALLVLSSAFDVIDHGMMLTRLQRSFGVTAEALDWMRSYISGRTQCVSVSPATSFNAHLCCGVPHGSVLGLKLYCIYTKPVGAIVKKHNLLYHCYADDTQNLIYLSIKPDENWDSERSAIEACVADVGGWMNRNMLKLNQEKSELIVFSSKHRIRRVNDLSLTIGGRRGHTVE